MLAPLLLVALPGCGTAPPATASDATPAIWRVADADTEIWLFGTIHALPPGIAWSGGPVGKAIARADTLVLEVGDITDARTQAARFLKVADAPGLPPLAERIPAADRAALDVAVAKSGLPAARLDAMKSWAAAIALGASQWREQGAERSHGIDSVLAATFRAAGKPIVGLETAEQQFGFFDALPEDAQRRLLVDTVRDGSDAASIFSGMVDAWKRGDPQAINATFDEQLRGNPALKAILLDARNARWAQWIAGRMRQPGRVLVAVGAGHLAGEGSVQQRLTTQGIVAKRLR